MATFTSTQTDTVMGKLTNGRKLVLTVVTIADAGVEATTITVKPLTKIIAWVPGWRNSDAKDFIFADQGTIRNQITVTPSADATDAVLEILSVGE